MQERLEDLYSLAQTAEAKLWWLNDSMPYAAIPRFSSICCRRSRILPVTLTSFRDSTSAAGYCTSLRYSSTPVVFQSVWLFDVRFPGIGFSFCTSWFFPHLLFLAVCFCFFRIYQGVTYAAFSLPRQFSRTSHAVLIAMPEAVLFAEAPVRKKTGSLVTEYPAVMNGLEDDASAGGIPLDSL